MLWNEVNLVSVIHLDMTSKKISTLNLTWCTPYIPMKQTLFIANVLSSNCGRCFFLDQIWVCVYFSWWYPPTPPQPSKSCPSDRKTHSGNYKSTCCQYIRSIYLINFKKRSIWPSNFGALALVPRSQKKNSRYGKPVLHPFKWIYYHETNV